MSYTIKLTHTFDDEDLKELWTGVFGAGLDQEWWYSFDFTEGSWSRPGVCIVEVENPEGDELIRKGIVVQDLAEALAKVINDGCRDACTHKPIRVTSIEDIDVCIGDTILQYAVFGKIVYN